MNWKKPLATESDIEKAVPGNVSKLNFGDGLHLRVHKKGYKYFQLRICQDGKDMTVQLGKHPEMTLAHAEEKAATHRARIAKVRAQKADLAFLAKLKSQSGKSRSERYGTFKNIEDAAQFIRNIQTGPCWHTEIGQALVLQLLIPARWNDIVRAQSAHFDRWHGQWRISQRRAGASHNAAMHFSIAYLSQRAMAAVEWRLQSMPNGMYLFPVLAGMSKSARADAVADVMSKMWPNYLVDPEGLPSFFEAMANQHSYFRSELIAHTVSHKAGPRVGYRTPSSYILQRRALADWWGNELMTASKWSPSRAGGI